MRESGTVRRNLTMRSSKWHLSVIRPPDISSSGGGQNPIMYQASILQIRQAWRAMQGQTNTDHSVQPQNLRANLPSLITTNRCLEVVIFLHGKR